MKGVHCHILNKYEGRDLVPPLKYSYTKVSLSGLTPKEVHCADLLAIGCRDGVTNVDVVVPISSFVIGSHTLGMELTFFTCDVILCSCSKTKSTTRRAMKNKMTIVLVAKCELLVLDCTMMSMGTTDASASKNTTPIRPSATVIWDQMDFIVPTETCNLT